MKTYSKKVILITLILFLITNKSISQSSDCNYIQTSTYLDNSGYNVQDQIEYFDGIGRTIQIVQKRVTPQRQDLRIIKQYDSYGRETNNWLPVPYMDDGKMYSFVEVRDHALNQVYNDNYPYVETIYDDSPANKIIGEYGAGQNWRSGNKKKTFSYLTNVNDKYALNCIRYYISNDDLSIGRDSYSDGELFVAQTSDADGNTSYEFRDKEDLLILQRSILNGEYVDTYYVYDKLRRLRYVLPPMIEGDLSQSNLELYAFSYKYDKYGRCIEKKLPGADVIRYYYDKADRLIFSQDGEQRNRGEYSFKLYDVFGREVVTGICQNITTPDIEEQIITATFAGNSGWARTGYAINGNLNLNNETILKVNYYDNYDFFNLEITNGLQHLFMYDASKTEYNTKYTKIVNGVDISAKGLLTASFTNIIDSPLGIYTVNYYDDKGHIIQTRELNNLLALDINYHQYTFTGKVKKHLHEHLGSTTLQELYTYYYDHAERLTSTTHQLNGGPAVTLSENSYNELGQLSGKSNHGGLNPITYNYNIRSWIISMNSGKFTENLSYSSHYNGNISSMSWNVENGNMRTYTFTYDNLNRLKGAVHREAIIQPGGGVSQRLAAYNMNVGEYDKHGNIKNIVRRGYTGIENINTPAQFGVIDDLSLSYNGNQLLSVTDDSSYDPVYHGAMHFVDGANESQEYVYDRNGNLTIDKNKGIKLIEYNHLNLPQKVTLKNTSSTSGNWFPDHSTGEGSVFEYWIKNDYDASGTRRSSFYYSLIHTTSPGGSIAKRVQLDSKTDYCGNIIYKNDVLDKILIPEGYIDKNENGIFVYHYYLKDHLGNNRVVIDQNGTIEQVNHYYPFGALFGESTGGTKQPYKYNGKELERMGGLDIYDYSARAHDPILGRFTTIDPRTEEYYDHSPYVYCGNNPITRNDPDGEAWNFVIGALVGAVVDYGAQVMINYATGKTGSEAWTDVSVSSIAVSAAAGATGAGLGKAMAKVGAVSNAMAKGGKSAAIAKVGSDAVVGATTSAGSQMANEGKIDARKLAIDTGASIAGGAVGGKIKSAAQSSNTGKVLNRQANRANRLAGENSRQSRKDAASIATNKAENYGNKRATAASAAVSEVSSKAINIVLGKTEYENYKK